MVSGFDFPLHQSMDYCVFHWVLVFPFIIPILFLFQYDSNIFQCDSNKLFQYDSNKWFQGIIPIQLLGFPTSHAERSKESRRNLPTSARFVMKFLALAGSSDGEVPCLMSGINTMEVPKIWVYMGLYIYGFIWVQSHTLAQKHHCEFCCGVHRSCTKQSLQNWQERLVDSTRTSVRSMLSTSLLKGRFWCSWTIHTWSKVIPDCDNSAEKKWKLSRHAGTWLSRSP